MRKIPFFEHEGARLFYEATDQGEPLIFLRGFGWDMRQWKNEVEYFSSDFQVITLDARGHGQSSLPSGEVPCDIFWKDAVV